MTHKYDFYLRYQIERNNWTTAKKDFDNILKGSENYSDFDNFMSRIHILNTAYDVRGKLPIGNKKNIQAEVYAKVGDLRDNAGLKALIHSNRTNRIYNQYIEKHLKTLQSLHINESIDIDALPVGSCFLEFPVALETSFISKDDIPLYIIENPVRKDIVFGIPLTSPTGWKGNLRWTMMKIFLEENKNTPEIFAQKRLQHALLFGSEKGLNNEDEERSQGWAKYLDQICKDAKKKYRDLVKVRFKEKDIPDIGGMLHFYPTFWDKIDMEVMNPHDRKRKAGKNPIYYEVVPAGAQGVFRLVYVPFHYLHLGEEERYKNVLDDICAVVEGLRAMMLTYGFSAKKTIGYGTIKNSWEKKKSRFKINRFHSEENFENFEELESIICQLKEKKA